MGLINSKVSGRKKNEQTTEIMDDLEPEVKEVDSDVIVVTEEKEDVPEPSQKIPRKRRSEVENLEIPEDIPEAAPLKKSSGKSMPRKRRSEAEQFQAKKKFESEGRQKKPARRSSKSAVDEIDENETSSDENSSDSTPKFSRIVPRKRRSEESKGRPKKPARRSGINVKVDEEDTSSDEDSSTPKSSKRSPPSTIKRRSSYTLEEEEEAWNEILKIIYDAETDTWKTTKVALKGNRFWEDFIEEHDSSRTVSSWNTHFRKYTYPNLYKMPFDWEQKVNMYMCLQIPVTDEARRALEQEGNIKLVLDAIDRIWKWKPKPKTSEQDDSFENWVPGEPGDVKIEVESEEVPEYSERSSRKRRSEGEILENFAVKAEGVPPKKSARRSNEEVDVNEEQVDEVEADGENDENHNVREIGVVDVEDEEVDEVEVDDEVDENQNVRGPPKKRVPYSLAENVLVWSYILRTVYDEESDTWQTTEKELKGHRFWKELKRAARRGRTRTWPPTTESRWRRICTRCRSSFRPSLICTDP